MSEFEDLVKNVFGEDTEEPTDFKETRAMFYDDVRRHLLGMGATNLQLLQREGDTRFSTALPLEDIRDATIAIVGVGGLGNHVWRILLGMGFRMVHLFDDDVVEAVNVGPQMHRVIDIGLPKVLAARDEALAFRGIAIGAHKMKVSCLADIETEIGRTPDILIGLTDSADFRNGIIGEFETRHDLPLFIDCRMSLGDWNCYCFTPQALGELDAFDKYDFRRRFYDRYSEVAVFTEEEAVQEPCTERSIVYTGACVAAYIGAFVHWWFVEGRRLMTSRGFADAFYSDSRAEGKFNWLMRFSSREFKSETRFAGYEEKLAEARVGNALKHAVVMGMSKLWKGMRVATPGDDMTMFGTEYGQAKAFLDMNGDMHVQKDYAFVPSMLDRDSSTRNAEFDQCEFVATLDLNFTRAKATLAVDVYKDDTEWLPTKLAQEERVSAPKVHCEILQRNHAAAVMMDAEKESDELRTLLLELWLQRPDNGDDEVREDYLSWWTRESELETPICCVVANGGQDDGRTSMIAVRLVNPEYDKDSRAFTFEIEAWKATASAKSPMKLSAASLPAELASMNECDQYCSGWTRFRDDILNMRICNHVDEDGRYTPPVVRDYSEEYEKVVRVLGTYPGATDMCLCNVPDGAGVVVQKKPGKTYWKGSDGTLTFLLDRTNRKLYVSPRLWVRIVEWP